MKLSRRNFVKLSGIGLSSLANPYRERKTSESSFMTWQKPEFPETWIELDMQNIGWNLDKIKSLVKKPVLAVIKANAYGHGLEKVGKYLDRIGIDGLMVSKLQEAVRLRKSGISCPILNFGPFFPQYAETLLEHNITPFITSSEVAHLNRTARKRGKKIQVHIHIDTGMNRMGISHKSAYSFINDTSGLDCIHIAGVSTTLTEDEAYDKVQLGRFLSVCNAAIQDGVEVGRKHIASSAGILNSQDYFLDMVRPGILLYGYYPNEKTSQEDRLSLKPALQFKTRVAEVKSLQPGDSISYHRAFTAKKNEKIAVLPVGYSDGYPPSVTGKGSVLIKGKEFPVIASITANHTEVLLNGDSAILPGEEAVLIGSQEGMRITADNVAEWAEISNYKVLIGLNPSLLRTISQ